MNEAIDFQTSIVEIVFFITLFLLLSPAANAARVQGRFAFGAYASTERFSDANSGSDSNDVAIISSRAFLKVSEIGIKKYDFIVDLRDKNDFFDKLNAERLRLDNRNDLQVRQVSVALPTTRTQPFGGKFGRFPVAEAGSAFVDGAQIESRLSVSTRSAIFAGYNPKQDFQSYVQWDPKAQIYGADLVYQDVASGWNKNFYLSNALVDKTYNGHTDRTYLYENAVYQWSSDSRIISLLYLDFVPRTYVQTGDFIWQQRWTSSLSTQVEGLAVDAIEYARRQGVLEKLPSSPYKEGLFQLNYLGDANAKSFLRWLYGVRGLDGFARKEVDLGWLKSGLFAGKWDVNGLAGVRRNFTSRDVLVRSSFGYFSRAWESTLDLEYAVQSNDNGLIRHPATVEWSLSRFFAHNLYTTLALERAWDETVSISSIFFRVGYNFGDRELAPIRDGAPPRGAL